MLAKVQGPWALWLQHVLFTKLSSLEEQRKPDQGMLSQLCVTFCFVSFPNVTAVKGRETFACQMFSPAFHCSPLPCVLAASRVPEGSWEIPPCAGEAYPALRGQ